MQKLVHRRPAVLISLASLIVAILLAVSYRAWHSGRPSAQTPKVTPVTSYKGYEFHPALSPDGKQMAFVWNGEGNNFDIYVQPIEGGDPVRLTRDPAHDLHPTWSPDGGSIAFVRTSATRQEVMIIPEGGGTERKVLEIRTDAGQWEGNAFAMRRSPGPTWSPDGKSLAVENRPGPKGPDRLYLVSPDSGAQHGLTQPGPLAALYATRRKR